MIRSIAKFLIQYSYDSQAVHSKSQSNSSDRLPRWLRRWTNHDLQLRKFERDLLRLEGKLIGQADTHIANGLRPDTSADLEVCNKSKTYDSVFHSPVALTALAAGLVCVLLAGRWFLTQPSSQLPNAPDIVSGAQNESKQLVDVGQREEWVLSTLKTTKRLANQFKQKSSEANNTLMFVNRTMLDEEDQIKALCLEGLKFVGQKLPAATVRMLGMNETQHF